MNRQLAARLLAARLSSLSARRTPLLDSPFQARARKRDVTSRVCAALIGGYVAASASCMLLARMVSLS